MASLKEYRTKIAGVLKTKRITAAMKTVAAARLRRAQMLTIAARPYSQKMEEMVFALSHRDNQSLPVMLQGRQKKAKVILYLVIMTDRGLCGALNSNLARLIVSSINKLKQQGKTYKLFLVGRKASAFFVSDYAKDIIFSMDEVNKPKPNVSQAKFISDQIKDFFDDEQIDECIVCYNHFSSIISQKPMLKQIIPVPTDEFSEHDNSVSVNVSSGSKPSDSHNTHKETRLIYDFEPSPEAALKTLLPRYLLALVYQSLVEEFSSELAARMTSMDNATRNAERMVDSLALEYNRKRQSAITSEIIEIISGAEALNI